MHTAPSVILFTVLSGAGFGLLAFLGAGFPMTFGWAAFGHFFLGYALAVAGLMFSVLHLGRPARAIHAFSQWRSSWLSREGIMAVATLLGFAPVAIARIFFQTDLPALGLVAAVMALATVFTTAMIYTQIKAIPRWNMALTPALFLTACVTGGAILSGQGRLAGGLVLILTVLQLLVWQRGDRRFAEVGSTMTSALGITGTPRLFEASHTARNYVLDEMVHRIGRKHGTKLRIIAVFLIGILPGLALIGFGSAAIVPAAILHLAGMFTSRWLFFAEAEHVVGLYYGKS